MSADPLVSILTTIYNREAYLSECIESVQTGKFHDYEHILVDDQSTDASAKIALQYAKNDPRIKVHVNAQNLGDYPNRNEAASLAQGKYIKYLDADDQHGLWILNIMVDAMESFPNAGLGLIDYSTDSLAEPIQLTSAEAYRSHYTRQYAIFERSPLGAIIRQTAFQEVGGFSGKRMVGDFELWHKIARQFPVVVIPHNLASCRRHHDSESAVWHSNPIWPLLYKSISLEHLEHPNCPLEAAVRELELQKTKRQAARSILIAIRHHGLSKANEMREILNWGWAETLKFAFNPVP